MKRVRFSNKKIKPVFSDKRGHIFDILEDKVGHIGMVAFTKGAVRGNHYHKKSIQYSYVLDGKIELTVSHINGSKKRKYLLRKDTLTVIPPNIVHTYKGLTKASMLDMTTLSRTDDGYEKDTVRIHPVRRYANGVVDAIPFQQNINGSPSNGIQSGRK